jgi:hypothetical protein
MQEEEGGQEEAVSLFQGHYECEKETTLKGADSEGRIEGGGRMERWRREGSTK